MIGDTIPTAWRIKYQSIVGSLRPPCLDFSMTVLCHRRSLRYQFNLMISGM